MLQSIGLLQAIDRSVAQTYTNRFSLPYARGLAVILAQAEYVQQLTPCAVIQQPTEDDLHDMQAILKGHFKELTRTKHDLLRPVVVKKAATLEKMCSMSSRATADDQAKINQYCKKESTKNVEGQRAVAWLGQMKYMHTIDTDIEWPPITPQGFKDLIAMIKSGKDTINSVDPVARDAAYLYKHYQKMVVKTDQ